jgi:hypothetical protein
MMQSYRGGVDGDEGGVLPSIKYPVRQRKSATTMTLSQRDRL